MIRVDSPSDVIFVKDVDQELLASVSALKWYQPETLSVDQLRVKGNECFVRKDYEGSLYFYDRALRVDPKHPVVLLNKTAVLLQLERFYEAHQLGQACLDAPVDRQKVLYRYDCIIRLVHGQKFQAR